MVWLGNYGFRQHTSAPSTQTANFSRDDHSETFDVSLSGSETPLREHLQLTPFRSEITPPGKCPQHFHEQHQEFKRIKCVLSTVYGDVHGPGLNGIQQAMISCPKQCAKHQAEINRIKRELSRLYSDVKLLRHKLFGAPDSDCNIERSEPDAYGSDDSRSTLESSAQITPESLISGNTSWNSDRNKASQQKHKKAAEGRPHHLEPRSNRLSCRNLLFVLGTLAVLVFALLYQTGIPSQQNYSFFEDSDSRSYTETTRDTSVSSWQSKVSSPACASTAYSRPLSAGHERSQVD